MYFLKIGVIIKVQRNISGIIRDNKYATGTGGFYRKSIHGGILSMQNPLKRSRNFIKHKKLGAGFIKKVAGKQLLK